MRENSQNVHVRMKIIQNNYWGKNQYFLHFSNVLTWFKSFFTLTHSNNYLNISISVRNSQERKSDEKEELVLNV